jgi:hypothetical protein
MTKGYAVLMYDADNGDGWLYCACFEKSVDPEYRVLTYLANRPGKVHGDTKCMLCGNRGDWPEAQAAAGRIADVLMGTG